MAEGKVAWVGTVAKVAAVSEPMVRDRMEFGTPTTGRTIDAEDSVTVGDIAWRTMCDRRGSTAEVA